jgi:hypothetical protein
MSLLIFENIQRNKMSQQDKCYIFNKVFLFCKGNVNEVAKLTGYCVSTVRDYIFLFENLSDSLNCKLDAKGESKLSMEIALLLAKHIPKEKQFEIYEMISSLGTTEMKRQAVLKFVNQPTEDDDELEEDNSKPPNESSEEKEKKAPIPKQPWVYDENGNPLVIPKELYAEICQLIKNNQ